MKYIRTKDGIYELDCSLEIRDNFLIKKGYYYCIDDYCEDESLGEIIAQADTIEELCDLYIDEKTKIIFHKYNGNKYVIEWKTNLVYSFKDLARVFPNVKGAIYTDKGLIYVVKMNENGGLELI